MIRIWAILSIKCEHWSATCAAICKWL